MIFAASEISSSRQSAVGGRQSAGEPRPRGFTLIELMVVMGIIIFLAAIALPVLFHVRKTATRTKMAADLQTISVALDAYKADFGDYPRAQVVVDAGGNAATTTPDRPNPALGAQILCRALVGPAPAMETPTPGGTVILKQDGFDGPGFRIRQQGKPYGPYLATDRFRVGDPASPSAPNSSNVLLWTILDSNNQPILYFPAAPSRVRINITTNYAGKNPTAPPQVLYLYNVADNLGIWSVSPLDDQVHTIFTRSDDTDPNAGAKRIGILLGDYDPANTASPPSLDNGIDGNEHAATTGPYILWSAGPDGIFGCGDKSLKPTASEIQKCDDVTNFNMGTQ